MLSVLISVVIDSVGWPKVTPGEIAEKTWISKRHVRHRELSWSTAELLNVPIKRLYKVQWAFDERDGVHAFNYCAIFNLREAHGSRQRRIRSAEMLKRDLKNQIFSFDSFAWSSTNHPVANASDQSESTIQRCGTSFVGSDVAEGFIGRFLWRSAFDFNEPMVELWVT